MLISNRKLLIIPLVIGLAVLFYMGYLADTTRFEGLTLILPKQSNSKGVSVSRLEELDESLLLAYSVTESDRAEALNSKFDITAHYTNYLYPFATGYQMAEGGFFGQDKHKKKSKTAVLNEQAAFKMFGGADVLGGDIKVSGEKYKIVGVIRDGETESMNVYLPITLTAKQPNSFILRCGSTGEFLYAANEIKQAGISDTSYDFEKLDILSKRIAAKAVFAIGIAVCAVGFLLLRRSVFSLVAQIKAARSSLEPVHPAKFGKMGITAGFVVGLCAAFAWLLVKFVESFLYLEVSENLFRYGSFNGNTMIELKFLQNLNLYSDFVLIGVILVTIIIFALEAESYK